MSLEPDTTTANGAAAFSTTGSKCVDLFFGAVRGLSAEPLHQHLSAAWDESPLATLVIIFQTRDCRGGKGERALFLAALAWLYNHHPETFFKNLKHIPFYGTWKDLLELPVISNADVESAVLQLFADQLRQDMSLLQQENAEVSMCAKWAPTERHKHDKAHNKTLASKLARLVFPDSDRALKLYRVECLSALRTRLKVTERKMCAREWDTINYSSVPSRCMHLNKNAFRKHAESKFMEYLRDVAMGKSKIQAKQLFPHELTNKCKKLRTADLVIELQWESLINTMRQLGTLSRCTVLSDVSGSMSGMPMDISIALGLFISELSEGIFHNQVITFESNPRLCSIQGDTLCERVKRIRRIPWGGSTNFQAALNLLLEEAVKQKIPADQMPKTMFVISDMHFNAADSSYSTNHEAIAAKFNARGFEPPTIVYWNVSCGVTAPTTCDTPGVILLSGYSPSLMKLVMEKPDLGSGETTSTTESSSEDSTTTTTTTTTTATVTPLETLLKVVNDERYTKIEL